MNVDYIAFTDLHFGGPGHEDRGLYLGLEGYGEITPNWHLGGEIGTGDTGTYLAKQEIFLSL